MAERTGKREHRVVIVGGGFGGLEAAKALGRSPVQVTLLDRRNFFLFQPLLYQVATGGLSPAEIAAPLRGILSGQKNARVLLGEVVDIDLRSKRVMLRDGGVLEYDSLIAATGSQSNYFGNPHWREQALSLRTVEEATAIRRKVLYAFEAAERETDPGRRAAWLTFVIVGAGATGVELAGALAEIARHTLRDNFRSIQPEVARILVLDGAPRVLPGLPQNLSNKAEESLVRLGVRVRTGVRVSAIDADGVTFEKGADRQTIPAKTVLWAGGVMVSQLGSVLAARTQAETDRNGRILVNPDLTVPGYPNVYVVGDLAHLRRDDGSPLPGVAPVAMQQGAYAARAIVRRLRGAAALRPFRYRDRGEMAVIGRASAVANVFGMHLWGYPAWLAWLFVHVMYLVEFRSRVMVLMQWGFQYLTFSRCARLITGHTHPPADPDPEAAGETA